MKMNYKGMVLLGMLFMLCSGCKKFLDEKSNKALSVPTTVEEFQAMLNSVGNLNTDFTSAGEVSSDDYYFSEADFNALYYESDKRLHTWQPDYVTRPVSSAGDQWYYCYKSIYVCNAVLKGLEDNGLTGIRADQIKGQALTFRAARYLDAVQLWAPAYHKQTASTDLGMVLRQDPDMNIPSVRSSVQQTYDQIIKDLTEAIPLLPNTQFSVNLPGKAAAHGLLARTYLFMGEYEKALPHAEAALTNTTAQVIDFNTLDVNAEFPIPAVRETSSEIIFWASMSSSPLDQSTVRISPELYGLYDNDDLRKLVYFTINTDGSYAFKGTHFGYYWLMSSLTPAELLLMIAECNVRVGDLSKAADALNRLLIKRWKTGEFSPYVFTDRTAALKIVLDERRKELAFRGLRWADIKRLNRDGYNLTLTRTIGGQTFTLPPNDPRYAVAIPETVIELSGIPQNRR